MWTTRIVLAWATLGLALHNCGAPPVIPETSTGEPIESAKLPGLKQDIQGSDPDVAFAAEYLEEYGHYGKYHPDPAMAELSEANMQLALRNFQKMAGLNKTGILDAPTLAMMKLPRCGVKDIGEPIRKRKKRYLLQGTSWHKKVLLYKMTIYSEDLSREDQDRALDKAFKLWSGATNLRFEPVKDNRRPDIELLFARRYHGDGRPFDGPGKTFAHAFFPGNGGDVHFDEDDKFTVRDYKGTNLMQVAAHELGHSLGLRHSEVKDALMGPFYKGYNPHLTLHRDDIKAIQALYGKPFIATTVQPVTSQPGAERTQPHTRPHAFPTKRVEYDVKRPNLCQLTNVDAAAYIKSYDKTFMFSGDYIWQLGDYGVDPGFPKRISQQFNGLTGPIDATLDLANEQSTIYFFKGKDYYRYDNGYLAPGYPKKIGTDGFHGLPANIDSAFIWGGNGRVYFTKGKLYYRITWWKRKYAFLEHSYVDKGYPKVLRIWKGLPPSVNSAVQWKNGKTYFFSKGSDLYYRFNDPYFRVDEGYPKSTQKNWLSCPPPDI